jgi:hypothetical protein
MRPILWIAAAALAAAPPAVPAPFEHAPPAPQSRLAISRDWIAYSERVQDVLQVVARRLDAPATEALVPLFRPSAGTVALASAFSPDGQQLYFETNARPTPVSGRDDSDVWVVARTRDRWGDPRPLGDVWATPFNEHSPTVDARGTVCINSARPDGLGENDLYCGTLPAGPRLLERVNSPQQDAFPTLAAAGDALVFASNRPGGLGGWDLYVTWRIDGAWSRPRNLGTPINSAADELGPSLDSARARLVFTRAAGEGTSRSRQILTTSFATRRLTEQD